MNSFFLTVAGILIAVLTLAFAVPHFIDWNSYRHVFEAQASKLVGRHVIVGGDVRLRLLPTPLLRLGEVRIANANGQIDAPFIQAESFTLWLSTPPLLSGTLVARQIEIDKPVINVNVTADGLASWRDMGPREDDLAFVPSEMALESVKFTDAKLAIMRGRSNAPIKLENLTGELSARSLEGPYKFAGHFNYGEVTRDIKFSTGRQQGDGSLRLKLLIRDRDGKENVTLDGILSDPSGRPGFEGQMAAQFGDLAGAPADKIPLEIRSKLTASLSKARFDEFELTLRKQDKPQVIRGRLDVGWLDGIDIGGEISSRWFDFDALAADFDQAPQGLDQSVLALVQQAMAYSAAIDRGVLQVKIDKAGLAGDVVSDLSGEIRLDAKTLSVSDLAMTLPGANLLRVSGEVGDQETGAEFSGSLALEGRDLSKLLAWYGISSDQLPPGDGADFALNGRVQAGQGRLIVEDAAGKLFGSAFTGGLRYIGGKRPKLALNLKSDRLDFARLFGPKVSVGSLIDLAASADKAGEQEEPADAETSAVALWMASGDAQIDLQIASAKFAGLDDVELAVKVTLVDGNFSIERFILRSSDGLLLRAEGGLERLDQRPKGRIMLTADAAAPGGIGSLWSILDLPGKDLVTQRAERLAPMRIAIAIESKRDSSDGLEARVGGAFNTSNIELIAQYTGSVTELDQGKFKIDGTIGNADGSMLMGQMFPAMSADKLKSFTKQRAELLLAAEGDVSGPIKTNSRFEAGEFRWLADGTINSGAEQFSFAGKSQLQAADVEPVLSLAGMDLGPRAETASVDIKAGFSVAGPSYRFADIVGTLAGAAFSGFVNLEIDDNGPVIEASFESESASLPDIMRPLLAWHRQPIRSNARRRAPRSSTRRRPAAGLTKVPVDSRWAERSFDLDAIATMQGQFSLKAKSLGLTGALVMDDAELKIKIAAGTIDVTKLSGTWEGGMTDASARLVQREDGLAVAGDVRIEGVELKRVSALGSGAALAEGTANIKVSLSGIGRTPKGLASSLSGEGTMAIADGAIRGFSPDALTALARSEIIAEISRASTLPARAASRFSTAKFEVEPATIAIAVKDGVAQIGKTIFDGETGEAAMTSYLELATMKLDSEWSLSVKPREGANQDLKVDIVFAGKVANFGQIAPKINTKALNRHVTVLRIAREVEQRAMGEERAREAAEAAKQEREAEVAKQAKAVEDARIARETAARSAAQERAAVERAAAERAATVLPPPSEQAPRPRPVPERAAAPQNEAPLPWTARAEQAPAAATAAEPVNAEAEQTETAEEDTPPPRPQRRPRSSSFEESGFSSYSN